MAARMRRSVRARRIVGIGEGNLFGRLWRWFERLVLWSDLWEQQGTMLPNRRLDRCSRSGIYSVWRRVERVHRCMRTCSTVTSIRSLVGVGEHVVRVKAFVG
jgi:hypothetical protein